MDYQVVVHITDVKLAWFLVDADGVILQKDGVNYVDIIFSLQKVFKSFKKNNYNISKTILLCEASIVNSGFLNITLGATDNFNECLANKLESNKIKTRNTVIKYKIISESNEDRIEYLLSLMIIPKKYYQSINKSLSKFVSEKSIQWIAVDYSLISLIVNKEEFLSVPFVIYVSERQTILVFKNQNQLLHIISHPFSVSKLMTSLKEDGFSDNQVQNKLFVEMDLSNDVGFNTQQLIYETLDDFQKEVLFVCSKYRINISSSLLISEGLKHSNFSKKVAEKLIIPCMDEALPEINPKGHSFDIINKALELVSNFQIFLTIFPNPKAKEKGNAKTKLINFKKEVIIFIILLFLIITGLMFMNLRLSHSLEVERTSLYGIKEQLTVVKTKYIEMSESLYTLKVNQNLQRRIINLERNNQAIKSVVENVYSYLPEEIELSDISLRNNRILIKGQAKQEQFIHSYLEQMIEANQDKKMLLRRIVPGSRMGFVIEVQI